MTTHEHIIEVLKASGAMRRDFGEVPRWIERFYAIAKEDGRIEEREECAKECDHLSNQWPIDDNMFDMCAKAIRERK